jgi:hypothetical protein
MPLLSDKKDLGKRQLKTRREGELMLAETDLSADGTQLSQHAIPLGESDFIYRRTTRHKQSIGRRETKKYLEHDDCAGFFTSAAVFAVAIFVGD